MAAKTGNIYISGITVDMIDIPTANPGFRPSTPGNGNVADFAFIILFPVVGHYRNHLPTDFRGCCCRKLKKNSNFADKILTLFVIVPEI